MSRPPERSYLADVIEPGSRRNSWTGDPSGVTDLRRRSGSDVIGCRFAIELTDFSEFTDSSDFSDDDETEEFPSRSHNSSMVSAVSNVSTRPRSRNSIVIPSSAMCTRCGRLGHLTGGCTAKTHADGGWLIDRPKKKPCGRCGRNNHVIDHCIATSHLSGSFIEPRTLVRVPTPNPLVDRTIMALEERLHAKAAAEKDKVHSYGVRTESAKALRLHSCTVM